MNQTVVGLKPTSLLVVPYEAFLGHVVGWYKLLILGFLAVNPVVLWLFGPFALGWVMVLEFIATLALSLRCHPLLPGGLLAMEVLLLGMTTPETFYAEVKQGLPVILLVTFMVSGVHFLRDFLFMVLTRVLLGLRSRVAQATLTISAVAALSAFLDALTILAVLLTVSIGFYDVYHRVTSIIHGRTGEPEAAEIHDRVELEGFRAYLRGMLMHAAVGTAIGGVCTLVGEPENIVVASLTLWTFGEFFLKVAPISVPTLVAGVLTCAVLERYRLFGFGAELPPGVRRILEGDEAEQRAAWTAQDTFRVVAQGGAAVALVAALSLHVAEVGLVGLGLLVLGANVNGVTDEHRLAKAFEASMPFVALLVVFFAIVAMIETQHLFDPVIGWALGLDGPRQLMTVFATSGVLSSISDNVFVATIYIEQAHRAFESGLLSEAMFDRQASAIVMGTGIPAMATPNGQAAFLFLLTSAIAQHVRLSYGRMVWMALPYTLTTSATALVSVALMP